jgi:hypothetical protein
MNIRGLIQTVIGGLSCLLVAAVVVLLVGRVMRAHDDPGQPETWAQHVDPPCSERVVYVPNPERLTWNSLIRDYGIELVCLEQTGRYGTGRPVNWGNSTALIPCSRVVGLKIRTGSGVEWIERDGRKLR